MPTSISLATSLATPNDLMNYVHPAQLGDWCSNDGSRVAAGAIPSNPVVLVALQAAWGEFESAVIRGKRYLPADFQVLTGTNLQQVVRLVCNIAKFILWSRVTRKGSDETVPPGCKEALAEIDRIVKGEHVFAFLETQQAAGAEAVSNDGQPIPPLPKPPFTEQAYGYFGNRLSSGWNLPG